MFKVKRKLNGVVYTVYFVKQGSKGIDCQFLIYDPSVYGWLWICSGEVEPVEE